MVRIFAIIALLSLPIGYYIYSAGQKNIIRELKKASQENDLQTMSNRIAWEKLRKFTKADITKTKKALGNYGTTIGPHLSKVDEVVDYYILPENLALLFHYHDKYFPDVTEDDFIHKIGYAPPFGFSVTLGYPENAKKGRGMNPLLKERLKVKAVFRLSPFTWKMTELHVPVFMVPERTYSWPAVQYYGLEPRSTGK